MEKTLQTEVDIRVRVSVILRFRSDSLSAYTAEFYYTHHGHCVMRIVTIFGRIEGFQAGNAYEWPVLQKKNQGNLTV